MLDLSALEEKIIPVATDVSAIGKPMEISIDDVEEDGGQPRKEFSEEKMAEMAASIKLRGVRQPVSVRPHPEKQGKWILNFGARRLRGSRLAGKTSIPAFVDDTSDDFDQVIENENRENLKPMELALFIKNKLDQGVKKAEIARRLTRPASTITELLALIDAPGCIEQAYRSGKCTSPKTLYELRMLHNKFAEQVQAWCEQAEEITRKGVSDLSNQLKEKASFKKGDKVNDIQTAMDAPTGVNTENLSHDKGNGDGIFLAHSSVAGKQDAGTQTPTGDTHETKHNFSDGTLTSWPRDKSRSDAEVMKKPLLIVDHKGRSAAVLLNRRPSISGLIHIQYEDNAEVVEVSAAAVTIRLLTETGK